MSKLQILIPQYNETNEVIKPLLDSIAIQQNVNFDDIEVFIGNDGSDTKLSIDFLKTYNYKIQYHYFEHSRLAATRQKLQDLATADYIMFCDADDCFISTIALSMILQIMQTKCDIINCDFIEEHIVGENKVFYIPHTKDSVFVHGKVFRLEYLREKEIKWHPELHEHQDSPFNVLALTCTKNIKICKIPLYMWHDNINSISRKNGIYHTPNTWKYMLDSYCALINDFSARGYGTHACYYAMWALYATYWEMSHDVWKQDDIIKQKLDTYNAIKKFCKRYKLLIENCTEEQIQDIIEKTKKIAERRGSIGDMPPFEDWLHSILRIFK